MCLISCSRISRSLRLSDFRMLSSRTLPLCSFSSPYMFVVWLLLPPLIGVIGSRSKAGGGSLVSWCIAMFSRDFVIFVEWRSISSSLLSRDWRICSCGGGEMGEISLDYFHFRELEFVGWDWFALPFSTIHRSSLITKHSITTTSSRRLLKKKAKTNFRCLSALDRKNPLFVRSTLLWWCQHWTLMRKHEKSLFQSAVWKRSF